MIPAGTGMKRYQNIRIDTGLEYAEKNEEISFTEREDNEIDSIREESM